MAENKDKRTIEIIVNGQQANASLKDMNAAAAVLYSQFKKMSADDPGRAKLVADYRALKDRIEDVKTELTGVSQNAGVMKQALANAFALVAGGGILGLVGQVVGLGKAIFETTAKFQTYESVMTNALGDKSKAQQAMKDIQQMAAKTPFSVDELTGSFIKFVNRGLNPSMAEMTKLADLAASQGKSFDQLTEAVLDAGGGEFERLKEFGIKASKSGDQVSLSFKGITQSVKNTPEAINGAIMAFGSMKGVAGSTAAISATLEGQLSNLGDTSDQLKIKVGEGLKPMFTALLTLFGSFLGWIGRFLDEAAPLKDLFTAIAQEVRGLYREIADILESLGLFSAKTDTVKIAVEVLKVALTVLLIPLRTLVQAAKGVVDLFIDWYNKSELLRGVLGGLAAVVTTTFRAIKDDAIKYLGGVGDILVGIFTLDKEKILRGFRATLESTADLALGQGKRAAKAFADGMEDGKNSHITRRVRVETSETAAPAGPVGETLVSDKSGADAAEEKKREAAEKKRLAALARQHKAEEEAEIKHQQMLYNLAEAAVIATRDQRERELAAIEFDALRKALVVKGSAQERAAAITLIDAEAQVKKEELQARYDEQDKKKRQDKFAQDLADIDAEEVEKEALFQSKFEDALISQQQRDQSIYDAKHAALEAKLAKEDEFAGKTSKLYRATYKELEKLEKDKNKADLAEAQRMQKAKWDVAQLSMKTAGDVVQTTIDLLFQDEAARKKHHNMYTALSGAKIIMDGVQEVAAIWRYAAENPANGNTGGIVGAVVGGIQTALAVARTAVGLVKLREFSFAQGGRTGGGLNFGSGAGRSEPGTTAVSPMGTLMEMAGMVVAPNGRLVDNSGFAVAGIVHEDEYVVPKWMRADPQVAAVEQWLEARRLRGYFEGGTTGGVTALPAGGVLPGSGGESAAAYQAEMLAALRLMTQQLADVKDWQAHLSVQLHTGELANSLAERKQVELENGIRA